MQKNPRSSLKGHGSFVALRSNGRSCAPAYGSKEVILFALIDPTEVGSGTSKLVPSYNPVMAAELPLTADGVAASQEALLFVLVVFDLAFFFHSIFQACGVNLKDLILLLLQDGFASQLLAFFVLGG